VGCDPGRQERQEAAAKEIQATQMEQQLGQIKEGDYQVQVHIIEAKDLAANDFGGTSDPCIFVYILGQKKKTKVYYKVGVTKELTAPLRGPA
jgi:hypothetical protein